MSYKIQLFLLPFAGGNATSFQKLEQQLGPKIEPVSIEYAGRGSRLQEGYITEYDVFLEDVVKQMKEKRNPDLPYAIFGYSMGAAFAYEIASRHLLDVSPAHLFYGARACIASQRIREMSEDDFVEYAKTLGGFPEEVKNSRLFKLFIHPLKEDYAVAKQFHFEKGDLPNCDTAVFYSEQDTPFANVNGWKELTSGKTEFYELGSNHFFVKDHYMEMAECINGKLGLYTKERQARYEKNYYCRSRRLWQGAAVVDQRHKQGQTNMGNSRLYR